VQTYQQWQSSIGADGGVLGFEAEAQDIFNRRAYLESRTGRYAVNVAPLLAELEQKETQLANTIRHIQATTTTHWALNALWPEIPALYAQAHADPYEASLISNPHFQKR
jgi:hypothetical protein